MKLVWMKDIWELSIFKRQFIVWTLHRFRTFHAVLNILLSVKQQGYFVSFPPPSTIRLSYLGFGLCTLKQLTFLCMTTPPPIDRFLGSFSRKPRCLFNFNTMCPSTQLLINVHRDRALWISSFTIFLLLKKIGKPPFLLSLYLARLHEHKAYSKN